MLEDIALVIYYNYSNRYSFNALLGALESDPYFDNLKIFFFKKSEDLLENLSMITKDYKKVIVALSFFTSQFWDIKELSLKIKKEFKSVFLIAGGPHPTGDPYGSLKIGIDLVVAGEGEITFKELLKSIHKNEDIYNLNGIAFLHNNKYYYKPQQKKVDINLFTPFSLKYTKVGAIELSRGCIYKCYYCQTPRIFLSKQFRNIKNVITCLNKLILTGYKDLRFITSDAFFYKPEDFKINPLEELLKECKNIIDRIGGRIFLGTFPSEVRPESVTKENIELVLKYCSNDNIIIGAQSGSDKLLSSIKRSHTVNDVKNATKIVLDHGLKANVDFIFGLPDEKEDDRFLTEKLIEDLVSMGAKIHAHTFIPLPSTPYWTKKNIDLNIGSFKFLNKIINKGIVYGNWIKQLEMSEKIRKYILDET